MRTAECGFAFTTCRVRRDREKEKEREKERKRKGQVALFTLSFDNWPSLFLSRRERRPAKCFPGSLAHCVDYAESSSNCHSLRSPVDREAAASVQLKTQAAFFSLSLLFLSPSLFSLPHFLLLIDPCDVRLRFFSLALSPSLSSCDFTL